MSGTPLTAHSTIGDWLDHPKGGELMRGLLGQAGVGPEVLAPMRTLPLANLVAMSGGQLTQETVDQLVLAANDGTMPDESAAAPAGWQERITEGRFAGKTVIVTGAAGGIGRAVASRIAREGGRVIATDVSVKGLEALAESLANLGGGELVTVPGDITKADDLEQIVAAAGDRIDGLANVAGINDDFSPLHETSDEMWDRVLAINLTGPFRLMRAVLPRMIAAGGGSILNVSSEAALRGNASGNAYTVSKFGINGLTTSAAFMYRAQGIRVNAVAPGAVATGIPMAEHVSESGTERLAPFRSTIPSIATSEQLAASITFLLSDDGVNITGAILPSDGGWSIQ